MMDESKLIYPEEPIVIKPSTELIADEYPRSSNGSGSVHIFYSKEEYNKENAKLFSDTMGFLDFKCTLHDIEDDIDISTTLDKIAEESTSADFLIFCFATMFRDEGGEGSIMVKSDNRVVDWKINQIWTKFTAYQHPNLKDKPKILIFQVSKYLNLLHIDGLRHFPEAYEAPAEADLLIIFNRVLDEDYDSRTYFIQQLCENIKEFGKTEDIISLATCTESIEDSFRPIIISTLTRKFFVTESENRGHHLTITENTQTLRNNLELLNDKLKRIAEDKPKKKGSSIASDSKKNGESSNHSNRQSYIKTDGHPRKTSRSESINERPPWKY